MTLSVCLQITQTLPTVPKDPNAASLLDAGKTFAACYSIKTGAGSDGTDTASWKVTTVALALALTLTPSQIVPLPLSPTRTMSLTLTLNLSLTQFILNPIY